MNNILLVEDDEVDVMNVKQAFKKNHINHPLYIASIWFRALVLLLWQATRDSGRTRLILLDLNMPKVNGIEFCEELRGGSELNRIPVIVLTTSNEDRQGGGLQPGVAGYILKPVTFSNFGNSGNTE